MLKKTKCVFCKAETTTNTKGYISHKCWIAYTAGYLRKCLEEDSKVKSVVPPVKVLEE